MKRLLVVMTWLLMVPGTAIGFDQSLRGIFDLRGMSISGERSWLHQGLGKLRYDEDDEPVDLGSMIVEYEVRPLPTLEFRVVAAFFDDNDAVGDLSEAFVRYRPIPRSAWGWQAKAGAFYPPFSLENSELGWMSPFTLSFSALDTWLGEEIRTIGTELELVHRGRFTGSNSEFRLHAAAFGWNDPAGALVAWRGFALHDRQTRLFEELPLAEMPAFTPTGTFRAQEPYERPFTEMDDRIGYYAGGEWAYGERWRVKLDHYDNRADPTVLEDGQWAWNTRFDVLGVAAKVTSRLDARLGALRGETYLKGRRGEVEAEFRTAYLLLSQAWGAQRASLRFDVFDVLDRDDVVDDPNQEDGDAWTLAWFYSGTEIPSWGAWRVGVEALRIRSDRPARELIGSRADQTEDVVQVSLQWWY